MQVDKYISGTSYPDGIYSYAGTSTCTGNTGTHYGLGYTTPALVGRYTTIFYEDISSSLNGSTAGSYYYTLYSVNPSTGVLTGPICAPTSPIAVSSTAVSLIAIPISSLCSSPPSPPYFNTVADNSEWALKVTLTNTCGSTTSTVYFQIDDVVGGNGYYRETGNTVINTQDGENTVVFSPVPFSNILNANLNLADASNTSLVIMTLDGRVISNAWDNESMDKGNTLKSINTSSWIPGMYFYRLMINGTPYTGKIVKE